MPILPQEPDIYPDALLEADTLDAAVAYPWWAAYTLPRREKELVRRLRRLGITFYCPMVKKRSRSPAGRVRTSFIPLFSGYVFVSGNEEHRYRMMTTNCVSRCLEVVDRTELVRDLRQIYQLIRSEAPLTPEARIEPGARVRVRSGPLAGLEGTVLRRHGTQRLLVVVHFLQQGASVQLEDYQVEPLEI